MFTRLATLTSLGLNFSHIIDVGANRGKWTQDAGHVWPAATFLLVEANPMHREKLFATGYPVVISALGDRDGANVSMWESTDGRKNYHDTGNSMFKERTGKPWWVRPTYRRMSTLDVVFNQIADPAWSHVRGPQPNKYTMMLKLDVQGAEALVLRGASLQVVPRCSAILLELSILDYNHGAPRAFDMHSILEALGFRLYDILGLHYNSRGLLLQVDVLFLRKNHRFWTKKVTGLAEP